MVHVMHIADKDDFLKIKSGEKTVDVRLYDFKRRLVFPSDHIIFKCRDMVNEEEEEEMAAVFVDSVHVYSCPVDLLMDFSTEKCGIGKVESPHEAFLKLIKRHYPFDEGLCIVAFKYTYEDDIGDVLERYKEEKKHGNDRVIMDLR